ncbi:INO80 complex subunit D-like protein [Dinothrombium tinctorium]|uniref:INO80 complex subunit D-like protein n=1 Tax=Dinothrombium tinctorium TaxID=1965070 RepID=A0A3S3PDK4_9ACAR|nr:INO80 complex subunit D-like protein [Dinothrombium tinctorium]RWS10273.1 INO80 complex subunit D-like protein [Dinothrombium tinctorium]
MATTGIWDPVQRLLKTVTTNATSVVSNISTTTTVNSLNAVSSPNSTVVTSAATAPSFTQLKLHDIGKLVAVQRNNKPLDLNNGDTSNCKTALVALHNEATKISGQPNAKFIQAKANISVTERLQQQLQQLQQQQQNKQQQMHIQLQSPSVQSQSQSAAQGSIQIQIKPSSTELKSSANNTTGISTNKKQILQKQSSQPMFEGKHIHYSPIDQKPLCSYSGKLCKQRRINGYAFCIRHILEDKSSPFKQCSHVAKYNNQKCTNPIPSNEEREYCNSHMQAAGMLPKKERKEKNGSQSSNNPKNNTLLNSMKVNDSILNSTTAVGIKSNAVAPSGTVSISVSSSPLSLPGTTVTSSITTSLGTVGGSGSSGSLKITIPTSLNTSSLPSSTTSLNGTSNKHVINDKLKSLIAGEFDLMKLKSSTPINGRSGSSIVGNKKNDNTITISITSTNTTPLPASSQQANDALLNVSKEGNKALKTSKESNKSKICSKKRKRISVSKLELSQKVVYASRKLPKSCDDDEDDIFNYNVFSSSSSEEENELNETQRQPYPLVTMSQRFPIECNDFELSELRNQLISQKWLLNNFVKLKEQELTKVKNKVKTEIKNQSKLENSGKSYLQVLLDEKEARVDAKARETSESLRRGVCRYSDEDKLCSKPSLPFTRHCHQHILYNVDQLLFERCTAKCSDTFTQCSNPTFDIEREEPLCSFHTKSNETECFYSKSDDEAIKSNRVASSSLPISQKGRKKAKPVSGGKTGRRTKKKRRSTSGGKNGSNGDSVDGSFFSQDSSDATSCDVAKGDLSPVKLNLMNTSPIPSTTNIITTTHIAPGIPSLKSQMVSENNVYSSLPIIPPTSSATLTQSITSTERRAASSNRIEIPPALDVGVPNLAPGDEALVASLVADLPPLGAAPEVGADTGPAFADLIPDDDAFNDLFMDNLKNGDIPSKEEAEALEQALAAVSKDVHNLAFAAAVVSSGTNASSNINGDSPYYSHPVNGQTTPHQFHSRPGATTPLNMTEMDILGLASNILGSLTTEQQQQLNGLIDGALASGTLTSSPTLKSALASLTNEVAPVPSNSCVTSSTPLHPNSLFSGPVVARSVVSTPSSTTMHNITLPSPPPYAAQYNPPSAAATAYSHELPQTPQTPTAVSGLLLTPQDVTSQYTMSQVTFPSNLSNSNLVNGKLSNSSLPSLISLPTPPSGSLPVLRTMNSATGSIPIVTVKAGLETKLS